MKLSDFNYELPDELIANEPLAQRTASRLLVLEGETGQHHDAQFTDLLDLIQPNDLLVFNNTRVIPARLYGKKETGGKIEILIERVLGNHHALAHVRASKAPKPQTWLQAEGGINIEVMGRQDDLFELRFDAQASVFELLEQHGHMPLPPYIQRADEDWDRERYQTVFAQNPGAVAAPTAGLHFDKDLLDKIRDKGVRTTEVTLHVGAGTFQTVREQDLSKHIMHAEYVDVSQQVCDEVVACRERGGRVIAVGTTAVRSLESASQSGKLEPFQGDTRLFIKPGYSFVSVDAMVTNFHLPESTLLMLVSAFSGYSEIFAAYQHAIKQSYRFFSYGDAMFLTCKRNNI